MGVRYRIKWAIKSEQNKTDADLDFIAQLQSRLSSLHQEEMSKNILVERSRIDSKLNVYTSVLNLAEDTKGAVNACGQEKSDILVELIPSITNIVGNLNMSTMGTASVAAMSFIAEMSVTLVKMIEDLPVNRIIEKLEKIKATPTIACTIENLSDRFCSVANKTAELEAFIPYSTQVCQLDTNMIGFSILTRNIDSLGKSLQILTKRFLSNEVDRSVEQINEIRGYISHVKNQYAAEITNLKNLPKDRKIKYKTIELSSDIIEINNILDHVNQLESLFDTLDKELEDVDDSKQHNAKNSFQQALSDHEYLKSTNETVAPQKLREELGKIVDFHRKLLGNRLVNNKDSESQKKLDLLSQISFELAMNRIDSTLPEKTLEQLSSARGNNRDVLKTIANFLSQPLLNTLKNTEEQLLIAKKQGYSAGINDELVRKKQLCRSALAIETIPKDILKLCTNGDITDSNFKQNIKLKWQDRVCQYASERTLEALKINIRKQPSIQQSVPGGFPQDINNN